VCLLDASEDAQRLRLINRGDDPSLIQHHIAFAAWMREHITNPNYYLEVIKQGGWEKMQRERWITATNQQKPWKSYCHYFRSIKCLQLNHHQLVNWCLQ
jgi:hypothetical protein